MMYAANNDSIDAVHARSMQVKEFNHRVAMDLRVQAREDKLVAHAIRMGEAQLQLEREKLAFEVRRCFG